MRWMWACLVFLLSVAVTQAATFTVTTTADDPVGACDADCSLREAVIAANQTTAHDTIVVPAGAYVLTLSGPGEDSALTGDLDLLHEVTILGDAGGGTVIDGNLADRLVHMFGAVVELRDLTLTRGSTTGDFFGAGGILVEDGTLTMVRCTISDCATDGHGGGIFSLGSVRLERSLVTGNSSHAYGGGIQHAGTVLTLVNSTVSANTTLIDGAGGVDIDGLALATHITSCTFSANSGPDAAGLSVRSSLVIANTVVDGSCDVVPGMGDVQSEGGNLESSGDTCGLDHLKDAVNVAASLLALGPLQDNGGPTWTHALSPGSVALDVGSNPLCPVTDQRDWQRHDGACDIGAFELGAAAPPLFADGFESGDTSGWTAAVGG